MLLQMYGEDTMSTLLQAELENTQARYTTLIKLGRNDAIAKIVIARVEAEITTLKRKLEHEEEPRQEVCTRASTSGTTRRLREALYRYWVKCYGNNHAISAIPTSATL